jgi:hypothetical protein
MFRLPAFPRFVILFSVIAFVACSVAPADAQSTGAQKANVASPSNNAAAKQKQTKSGYVSTQTRMGCKMGGNCQR